MKCNILILLTLSLLLACSKDNITADLVFSDTALEARKNDNKVTICHSDGKGGFQARSVNKNALPSLIGHGDYIPDADGDGYTAIGSCTGSMDDCDDTDPEVNNLCTDCHCFNLESVSNSNLLFYYNLENNDCAIYGEADAVFLFYLEGADTMVVVAGIDEDERHLVGKSQVVNGVVIYPGTDVCIGFVESEDLTLAEFDSCFDGLRDIINANPGLIHICDMDNPPILADTKPEFQREPSIK